MKKDRRPKLEPTDHAWWEQEDDQRVAHEVFAVADSIRSDDEIRRLQIQLHASLYANRPMTSLDFDTYWRGEGDDVLGAGAGSANSDVTYNVIKSCVDTLTNRIAQHKPLPFFLSSEGSYSDQRRCKKMGQFVAGQFEHLDVFRRARLAFREACIYGTGLLKVHRVGDTFQVDNVRLHELLVPYEEAYYGTPRQMHHKMRINAGQLAGIFPEHREAILMHAQRDGRRGQMIEVVESWHLPSGPTTPSADGDNEIRRHDGLRTLCIADVCLLRVPWEHDYFPFCAIRFDEPTYGGFWGTGIGHSLRQIQVQLNEMVNVAQVCARRFALPIILLNKDAKISTQKVGNELGQIFEVNAPTDIVFATTEGIPEDVKYQVTQMFEKAFQLVGISTLSAQSKKPSGTDSAVALRELDDIETDRFSLVQLAYEELCGEVARCLIDIAREMHADGVDPETRVRSRRFFQSIRWSEIDLDDDKYVMDQFPTNFFSRTPTAKLQQATEYMQAGLLDPMEVKRAMDFPDLKAITSLETAPIDELHDIFSGFLEGRRYQAPEPDMPLQQGIVLATQYAAKARQDSAPQKALQKLRDWVVDAMSMMQPLTPQGQPMAPALPGAGVQPANPTGT